MGKCTLKIRDVKKKKDELKNKTNKTKRDSEATGGKWQSVLTKTLAGLGENCFSKTVGKQPGWHEFS